MQAAASQRGARVQAATFVLVTPAPPEGDPVSPMELLNPDLQSTLRRVNARFMWVDPSGGVDVTQRERMEGAVAAAARAVASGPASASLQPATAEELLALMLSSHWLQEGAGEGCMAVHPRLGLPMLPVAWLPARHLREQKAVLVETVRRMVAPPPPEPYAPLSPSFDLGNSQAYHNCFLAGRWYFANWTETLGLQFTDYLKAMDGHTMLRLPSLKISAEPHKGAAAAKAAPAAAVKGAWQKRGGPVGLPNPQMTRPPIVPPTSGAGAVGGGRTGVGAMPARPAPLMTSAQLNVMAGARSRQPLKAGAGSKPGGLHSSRLASGGGPGGVSRPQGGVQKVTKANKPPHRPISAEAAAMAAAAATGGNYTLNRAAGKRIAQALEQGTIAGAGAAAAADKPGPNSQGGAGAGSATSQAAAGLGPSGGPTGGASGAGSATGSRWVWPPLSAAEVAAQAAREGGMVEVNDQLDVVELLRKADEDMHAFIGGELKSALSREEKQLRRGQRQKERQEQQEGDNPPGGADQAPCTGGEDAEAAETAGAAREAAGPGHLGPQPDQQPAEAAGRQGEGAGRSAKRQKVAPLGSLQPRLRDARSRMRSKLLVAPPKLSRHEEQVPGWQPPLDLILQRSKEHTRDVVDALLSASERAVSVAMRSLKRQAVERRARSKRINTAGEDICEQCGEVDPDAKVQQEEEEADGQDGSLQTDGAAADGEQDGVYAAAIDQVFALLQEAWSSDVMAALRDRGAVRGRPRLQLCALLYTSSRFIHAVEMLGYRRRSPRLLVDLLRDQLDWAVPLLWHVEGSPAMPAFVTERLRPAWVNTMAAPLLELLAVSYSGEDREGNNEMEFVARWDSDEDWEAGMEEAGGVEAVTDALEELQRVAAAVAQQQQQQQQQGSQLGASDRRGSGRATSISHGRQGGALPNRTGGTSGGLVPGRARQASGSARPGAGSGAGGGGQGPQAAGAVQPNAGGGGGGGKGGPTQQQVMEVDSLRGVVVAGGQKAAGGGRMAKHFTRLDPSRPAHMMPQMLARPLIHVAPDPPPERLAALREEHRLKQRCGAAAANLADLFDREIVAGAGPPPQAAAAAAAAAPQIQPDAAAGATAPQAADLSEPLELLNARGANGQRPLSAAAAAAGADTAARHGVGSRAMAARAMGRIGGAAAALAAGSPGGAPAPSSSSTEVGPTPLDEQGGGRHRSRLGEVVGGPGGLGLARGLFTEADAAEGPVVKYNPGGDGPFGQVATFQVLNAPRAAPAAPRFDEGSAGPSTVLAAPAAAQPIAPVPASLFVLGAEAPAPAATSNLAAAQDGPQAPCVGGGVPADEALDADAAAGVIVMAGAAPGGGSRGVLRLSGGAADGDLPPFLDAVADCLFEANDAEAAEQIPGGVPCPAGSPDGVCSDEEGDGRPLAACRLQVEEHSADSHGCMPVGDDEDGAEGGGATADDGSPEAVRRAPREPVPDACSPCKARTTPAARGAAAGRLPSAGTSRIPLCVPSGAAGAGVALGTRRAPAVAAGGAAAAGKRAFRSGPAKPPGVSTAMPPPPPPAHAAENKAGKQVPQRKAAFPGQAPVMAAPGRKPQQQPKPKAPGPTRSGQPVHAPEGGQEAVGPATAPQEAAAAAARCVPASDDGCPEQIPADQMEVGPAAEELQKDAAATSLQPVEDGSGAPPADATWCGHPASRGRPDDQVAESHDDFGVEAGGPVAAAAQDTAAVGVTTLGAGALDAAQAGGDPAAGTAAEDGRCRALADVAEANAVDAALAVAASNAEANMADCLPPVAAEAPLALLPQPCAVAQATAMESEAVRAPVQQLPAAADPQPAATPSSLPCGEDPCQEEPQAAEQPGQPPTELAPQPEPLAPGTAAAEPQRCPQQPDPPAAHDAVGEAREPTRAASRSASRCEFPPGAEAVAATQGVPLGLESGGDQLGGRAAAVDAATPWRSTRLGARGTTPAMSSAAASQPASPAYGTRRRAAAASTQEPPAAATTAGAVPRSAGEQQPQPQPAPASATTAPGSAMHARRKRKAEEAAAATTTAVADAAATTAPDSSAVGPDASGALRAPSPSVTDRPAKRRHRKREAAVLPAPEGFAPAPMGHPAAPPADAGAAPVNAGAAPALEEVEAVPLSRTADAARHPGCSQEQLAAVAVDGPSTGAAAAVSTLAPEQEAPAGAQPPTLPQPAVQEEQPPVAVAPPPPSPAPQRGGEVADAGGIPEDDAPVATPLGVLRERTSQGLTPHPRGNSTRSRQRRGQREEEEEEEGRDAAFESAEGAAADQNEDRGAAAAQQPAQQAEQQGPTALPSGDTAVQPVSAQPTSHCEDTGGDAAAAADAIDHAALAAPTAATCDTDAPPVNESAAAVAAAAPGCAVPHQAPSPLAAVRSPSLLSHQLAGLCTAGKPSPFGRAHNGSPYLAVAQPAAAPELPPAQQTVPSEGAGGGAAAPALEEPVEEPGEEEEPFAADLPGFLPDGLDVSLEDQLRAQGLVWGDADDPAAEDLMAGGAGDHDHAPAGLLLAMLHPPEGGAAAGSVHPAAAAQLDSNAGPASPAWGHQRAAPADSCQVVVADLLPSTLAAAALGPYGAPFAQALDAAAVSPLIGATAASAEEPAAVPGSAGRPAAAAAAAIPILSPTAPEADIAPRAGAAATATATAVEAAATIADPACGVDLCAGLPTRTDAPPAAPDAEPSQADPWRQTGPSTGAAIHVATAAASGMPGKFEAGPPELGAADPAATPPDLAAGLLQRHSGATGATGDGGSNHERPYTSSRTPPAGRAPRQSAAVTPQALQAWADAVVISTAERVKLRRQGRASGATPTTTQRTPTTANAKCTPSAASVGTNKAAKNAAASVGTSKAAKNAAGWQSAAKGAQQRQQPQQQGQQQQHRTPARTLSRSTTPNTAAAIRLAVEAAAAAKGTPPGSQSARRPSPLPYSRSRGALEPASQGRGAASRAPASNARPGTGAVALRGVDGRFFPSGSGARAAGAAAPAAGRSKAASDASGTAAHDGGGPPRKRSRRDNAAEAAGAAAAGTAQCGDGASQLMAREAATGAGDRGAAAAPEEGAATAAPTDDRAQVEATATSPQRQAQPQPHQAGVTEEAGGAAAPDQADAFAGWEAERPHEWLGNEPPASREHDRDSRKGRKRARPAATLYSPDRTALGTIDEEPAQALMQTSPTAEPAAQLGANGGYADDADPVGCKAAAVDSRTGPHAAGASAASRAAMGVAAATAAEPSVTSPPQGAKMASCFPDDGDDGVCVGSMLRSARRGMRLEQPALFGYTTMALPEGAAEEAAAADGGGSGAATGGQSQALAGAGAGAVDHGAPPHVASGWLEGAGVVASNDRGGGISAQHLDGQGAAAEAGEGATGDAWGQGSTGAGSLAEARLATGLVAAPSAQTAVGEAVEGQGGEGGSRDDKQAAGDDGEGLAAGAAETAATEGAQEGPVPEEQQAQSEQPQPQEAAAPEPDTAACTEPQELHHQDHLQGRGPQQGHEPPSAREQQEQGQQQQQQQVGVLPPASGLFAAAGAELRTASPPPSGLRRSARRGGPKPPAPPTARTTSELELLSPPEVRCTRSHSRAVTCATAAAAPAPSATTRGTKRGRGQAVEAAPPEEPTPSTRQTRSRRALTTEEEGEARSEQQDADGKRRRGR